MKLRTKFNIGQWVYLLYANEVEYAPISDIYVRVSKLLEGGAEMQIFYKLNGLIGTSDESELFATKKELLNSSIMKK